MDVATLFGLVFSAILGTAAFAFLQYMKKHPPKEGPPYGPYILFARDGRRFDIPAADTLEEVDRLIRKAVGAEIEESVSPTESPRS